jgi:hypothetical protein
MPVFKMYKSSNYSPIAVNQPNRAGTINMGSFRGKGSYSRMFNYCKQNSPNPSGCINQFVAFIPPLAPKPTPTPTPTPDTSGNILFDISSFSKSFNSEGYPQVVFPDTTVPSVYEPLPKKVKNALTRAANRWAHFLSFTPEYINVIRTNIKDKDWKGITLDRFLISTYNPITGGPWGTTIATTQRENRPQTSFITGGKIYVSKEKYDTYTEYQLFHILSHEFGHILGIPCMTVKNNGQEYGPEVLPNIYFDAERNAKFYQRFYFPNTITVYKWKYQGVYYEAKGKELVKKENKDIKYLDTDDLVPLDIPGKHWSQDTLTYDTPDPNLRMVFRGLYNDIMVPEWDKDIDKDSHYLITELTLRALTDIYTPWNGSRIDNYKLKLWNPNYKGPFELPSAGEDKSFSFTSEKTIQFKGKVYDPPLKKEIEIEDEEEEDKSWFKETIIHNCCMCEPIYLDSCGECA